MPSIGQDSFLLVLVIRFVVFRQVHTIVATIATHDRSAVSHVHDEDALFDYKSNDGTGAAPVQHVLTTRREVFNCVKEVLFSFLVAVDDGLSWACWKGSLLYNELVQVISEEISTCVATVSIKDSEEAALWPILDILLGLRLHDIEDDADPVFVVVSDDALVCVGSIADDMTGLPDAALGWFPEWKMD